MSPSTTNITTGSHLLVYPFLSSGHIIPLLDLTSKLLDRGLTITLVVTPANVPLLDPILSRHVSCQPLVLPRPDFSAPSSSQFRLASILRSLRDCHYPLLLDWFQSHPSPPVAILSDFFLGWTHDLASKVGVPRVVFSPSGALAFCVTYVTWQDMPLNEEPENMDFRVSFREIPNSPSFPWWQLFPYYRMAKGGDPDLEFMRKNHLANMASWGIVFNTFAHLERDYLTHVEGEYFHENRVWAVGPVLPPNDDQAAPASRGGSSSVDCHEVMRWLDSKAEGSVVYVCFGSRTALTREQMNNLAAGLERSGAHFVWCVRQPLGDYYYGALPEGFRERVAGRGFVIEGWAPQVAILRHGAVGAFLTHCGWNSVLEGISAGVAMLTWPMGADQFANAQLLVESLGVGVRVGEATRWVPEAGDLALVLAEAVKDGFPERVRAAKLREAALGAVVKGGSSDGDLNEFVRKLNGLIKVTENGCGGEGEEDQLASGL